MSASDELRRLLDERGVEWRDSSDENVLHMTWNDMECWFNEFPDGWTAWGMAKRGTPEQAIDATLGRGTCRDLSGTGANGEQVFKCSECGCVLSLYDRDGSNNLCTSFIFDYPRYCPECGRKVVE